MGQLLFKILTYFIIYSFLGWVMESGFRSIIEKKLINTGFLRGPFCPIYGIGAIIMLIFLERFQDKPILLFIIAITLLTAWEYIVGVILEKLFNTKYWDYSDHKINFQGRICLTNSVCWGFLGVAFVRYLHPFVKELVSKIDIQILYYSITIISLVMLVDLITTVIKVKHIKMTLEKVDKLNKEIKEKLKEIKQMTKEPEIEKDDLKTKATENIQAIIDKLNKQKNRTILKLYKNVYRLKKAFPAINTKEITEVLSKKIDIRKKKKDENT
jgi:uncharacterized membrane protein